MTRKELTDLIDKVVGKRGFLRAPAWWVRKILRELVDWTESALSANSEAVLSSVDEKMTKVKPYILASSWESNRYVTIDGKSQPLSLNTPGKYYYTESFRFPADLCWVSFQHATLPVKDLSEAFKGCSRINGWPIDLRFLDTSETTTMRAMFQNTHAADFVTDNFDISSVTDLSYMFAGKNNSELKFKPTNNRKVNTVSHMFYGCSAKTITCNTYWAAPVDMSYMFADCANLESLNPGASYIFEASNVTGISYMFYNCKKLQYLSLWPTTMTCKSFDSVFEECQSLTSIGDIHRWKTNSAESMKRMFYNCSSLKYLDLSGFDTSKVTNMNSMFYNCTALTALTLSAAFFNSATLTTYDFSALTAWTNTYSLATLVKVLPTITAAKTIKLSANTKAALTDEQKETITTTKGWTIA